MNTLRSFVKQHALVSFFLLTYLISFSLFLTWDWANDDSIPWFTFGPLLAALSLTALSGGWPALKALLGGLAQWRVGWHWYAVAFALPALLALGAIGLTTLAGIPPPTAAQWASWPSLLLAFPIRLFFSGPFGEELGWRGFALPRLQAIYLPLQASLILAVLVMIWHLRYVFSGDLPLFALVGTLAVTILFGWLYNNTQGSILLVYLFHAADAVLKPTYTGVDSTHYLWLLVALWCVVAVSMVIYTEPTLVRRATTQTKIAPIGEPLTAK